MCAIRSSLRKTNKVTILNAQAKKYVSLIFNLFPVLPQGLLFVLLSSSYLPYLDVKRMTVTKLLTLGKDPAITAAFLAQVQQVRPGKYEAYSAHSLEELRMLAELHKSEIQVVLLGAAQTDEQVQAAKGIVSKIWGEGGVQVLRLPPSLLTPEGKSGGMMRWFLEHMDGPIEGECGCC